MSWLQDVSLTRAAPIPNLKERPRPCETRPRIFISWHPRFPQTPLYAYFKDEEYQLRWGTPGPRIQWAFQALGQPQKFETVFGPRKFPMSSAGVLGEIYRKRCFAANIASSVKLQHLSTKNVEPYMADVLRAIYYAQDVIELPATTPKSSRATKPFKGKDSDDEDDDTSQLPVPVGVKGRRASKRTSVAAKPSGALRDRKRSARFRAAVMGTLTAGRKK